MTIVSIHQPAYLPWLGYLDRIRRSDVFVFLDSVQFEKRSFINRNRIKTAQGPLWLTIPVRTAGHRVSTIAQTRIANDRPWQEVHLKSIERSYRRAPRFDECFPKLRHLYEADTELLADLCFDQLQLWLDELAIRNVEIVRSTSLPIYSKKAELILELCQYLGARKYISGPLGRDYLDESDFSEADIEIEYQDFQHPVYPQLFGEFIPAMSIVDCWLNTDPVPLLRNATNIP